MTSARVLCLYLLLALAWGGLNRPVQALAGSAAPEARFARALEFLADQDNGKARAILEELEKAKEPAGSLADVHYWLGEIYLHEKMYEQAILTFNEVIKGWPAHDRCSVAMWKQGVAFALLGDRKSAVYLYKKVLREYPTSAEANQSRIYLAKPAGDGAIPALPDWSAVVAPLRSGRVTDHVAGNRPVAKDAPTISITSPAVLRGVKLTARESRMTVTGQASSADGVAEVAVNGQAAALDERGAFSAEILLKPGENRITVTALGVNKVQATQQFTVNRESAPAARPAAAATAPPGASEVSGAYHALIIGNNAYQHLDPLKTAVNDAVALEKSLKDSYGFQTKLLLNATRKDTLSALNDFRKKLGAKDNLLIYYAGHGEFDREAGKAYWLPVDAQRDDPAEWIIADDITSSVRRLSSKHVLIISDSCYSGTLTRSAQTSLQHSGEREEFLQKMAERPSRTLMASGGNEPVADGGGSGHSIFADSLLRALKEMNRPVFAADELFYQHIKSRVAGRSDQVPEYNEIRNSGHDGGDFILGAEGSELDIAHEDGITPPRGGTPPWLDHFASNFLERSTTSRPEVMIGVRFIKPRKIVSSFWSI